MSRKLYDWQKECIKKIKNKNAIVTAPTGSGKTEVAFHWSSIFSFYDKRLNCIGDNGKIIFTAPIKALSNQRYKEIRKLGFDVGLETGDLKVNIKAPILCCTQEIYTLKYAQESNNMVIIDEVHYISQDAQRARAYVDGIRKTNISSKFLLLSATIGGVESFKNYVERLANRRFELYSTTFRPTYLEFLSNGINIKDVANYGNALVFVFSQSGCRAIAWNICALRDIREGVASYIISIADKLKVNNRELIDMALKGVGVYFGKMLPKEKLFVEYLYSKGIIDVVVGTDALSLGVNYPAEYVVFAQLAKYYTGPITKQEFLQMSGRAGRKGYFDTGYVTFLYDSEFENYEYNTEDLYINLLEKPLEPFNLVIYHDMKKILLGNNINEAILEEAKYVSEFSHPPISFDYALNNIREDFGKIEYILGISDLDDEIKRIVFNDFGRYYFNEWDALDNAIMYKFFKENEGRKISIEDVPVVNDFYSLLQFRKYLINNAPKDVRNMFNISEINKLIEQIDKTALSVDNLEL